MTRVPVLPGNLFAELFEILWVPANFGENDRMLGSLGVTKIPSKNIYSCVMIHSLKLNVRACKPGLKGFSFVVDIYTLP